MRADKQGGAVEALFIGGVGRSGTTILELSLGTDPRVVSLGEVVHLWERCVLDDEACGCGQPFSGCPFWTAVGQRAYGGWDAIDAKRVLELQRRFDRTVRAPQIALRAGRRQWRRELEEYASYYARLYAAAAEVADADVVVDSSKQASLPHILRQHARLNLKVLHCVRDSRAVAYSWSKQVRRPEARDGTRSVMTQYSPGKLALTWVRHNLVVDSLRILGVPVMRLRYEDWIAGPDTALGRVLAFVGLPPRSNDQVGPAWVNIPTTHTCSGNPMRFRTGRVRIREDDEWRQSLTRRSRWLVTTLTGPLMASYGYWRTK